MVDKKCAYVINECPQSKTENIVPKWMRFVKGVVDSEDIPLNLSRELLQDSAQIRKLRTVITNKFLRFLQDKAKKEERSFMEFYKDYGFFLKEGILSGTDQVKNLFFNISPNFYQFLIAECIVSTISQFPL